MRKASEVTNVIVKVFCHYIKDKTFAAEKVDSGYAEFGGRKGKTYYFSNLSIYLEMFIFLYQYTYEYLY